MSDQDEIKKTYIDSTKADRRHWTSLMLEEKKRTNDPTLNLSTWIIRQLPKPGDGNSNTN